LVPDHYTNPKTGKPAPDPEGGEHPHARVEVLWPDSGKKSFLEDACAYCDFRADNGAVEISKTMAIHLAKGVEPPGAEL
jgi:hypothetical protein